LIERFVISTNNELTTTPLIKKADNEMPGMPCEPNAEKTTSITKTVEAGSIKAQA
jgi:hypothetical protein